MKKKTILIGIATVFVILIAWQVYQKAFKSSGGPNRQFTTPPVAVEITAIRKATIRDFGNFTGTLIPKSKFTIAPKISGRLEKLMVNIGDRVKRGQLIAVLDDEEYSQQVIQAQADLKVTQANLEESLSSLNMAERELGRVQELHKKGIAADSELDSAKGVYTAQASRHKVALAQVANREAALKAAQVRLSYTRISASWETKGDIRLVGERFVDEGAMLMMNTPILSILEINPLIAVIHITDKDYFRIKKDQKAIISTDALPEKSVSGKIARIAPLLQETSREARIEIEFPNPEELFKPGMFINAQIEYTMHADTTVVPVSAVVKRNNQQGIFLADIENKKAQFVPVKMGIIDSELAEILEPRSFSGFVVTMGQHLLVDGSTIILPEEDQRKPDSKPSSSREEKSKAKEKSGEKR
ncbi:MAG: efflux RND transporter periplasmic adaptor subunit [Candidatus Aminicenantes bacterium]|nr:MAG: efflux RND transporter periplasmic adaptor subunit [Candidatus Aminicenantes bacterium]